MEKSQKKKHTFLKNLALALFILLILFVTIVISLNKITRHNQEVIVPDLYGMSIEKAHRATAANEFNLDVTDSIYSKRLMPGAIAKQNPKAGSHVKKGRRIILTVNAKDYKKTTMPNLVGFSLRQAKTEILGHNLNVGTLNYVTDIATDNVLGQKINGRDIEPGTILAEGTSIDLEVGVKESQNFTYVPQVLGYKLHSAKSFLIDNSLNISYINYDRTVKTYQDTLSALVYKTIPAASNTFSVPRGSEVSLFLTTDESKIIFPVDSTEIINNIQ
ncbi:MAG: PASTA domain-containing protein [Bacteroidales bacterium]